MRFLTDQDVYAVTVRCLRDSGHDVATAGELGLAQVDDARLLRAAQDQNRVLITRDRDFGALVFIQRSGAGVIYLRALPSTLNALHDELDRALKLYDAEKLRSSFIVIEPGRHRIRSLSPKQGHEGPSDT